MAWNPVLPANPVNSLLRDVLTLLEQHQLTSEDVLYIELDWGHRWCSFEDFAVTASLIDLDEPCNINPELRIVGDDWFFQRNEMNDAWDCWVPPAQDLHKKIINDVPRNLLVTP